jgi:CO/xanthine dehydrogenase Mo-binding subunit
MPDGYLYVDKNDVPGKNQVHIVLDDTPVFAEDTVEFIGDPIGMIVGPDEREVNRLLGLIEVEYEELPSVIRIEDSDTVFFDYGYEKGDLASAFAQADHVFEEEFRTGLQEHVYLETNGMIAEPVDDRIFVHGSLQCPYYVHRAVMEALGFERDRVQIKFDTTGGAFGGKEDYPSILAAQTAVAALKAGRAVRAVFGRREDIEFTSKRHPSICTYKAAVKDGKVTAMDIDLKYNGGAYTTLSMVVLQRGVIGACGVYSIENLKVRGRVYKTNTVPNGAFRGFGGPQPFFSVEMMMNHVARNLGEEPLAFKERHLAVQGDATATGGEYHFPVPLPEMIKQIDEACDFRKKRELYKNQTGPRRKGIGISLSYHGAGFTGAGERDLIKAVAKLHKHADGRVELLTAGTDMGQGLSTILSKIVANELDKPMSEIIFAVADTDHAPDSGPTVASRSTMIVGELLRRASIRLREQWIDGEEQIIEERFKEPDFLIPFDLESFHGDAYPTFSWAVNAVEVELDTITGNVKVLGAYGSFDVGTPIDRKIVIGQMEGGLLQGIGYASMEQMAVDSNGRIRNNSMSDYLIPTSLDAPNLQCMLYEGKYPDGPYGAKGAGELPAVGGAAAYLDAMEQALGGVAVNHIPFTAENALEVGRGKRKM